MPPNPLNPPILAVMPSKLRQTCGGEKPRELGIFEGYNRAIDDVILAISKLDLGIMPNKKELMDVLYSPPMMVLLGDTYKPKWWIAHGHEELAKAIRGLMLNETKAGMGEK